MWSHNEEVDPKVWESKYKDECHGIQKIYVLEAEVHVQERKWNGWWWAKW